MSYDIEHYNSVITELKKVALKDFQFKISNKILVIEYFLHIIGKNDENYYSYSHYIQETIFHLLIECVKVKNFWQQLRMWINGNANLTLKLDNNTIFFVS